MRLKKYINKMILTFVSSSMLVSSNLNADMDTLLEIPSNILQVTVAIVGLCLLVPIYAFSLAYDGDRNVTNDKRFKHLLYRTYALKENMVYDQFGSDSPLDPREVGHFRKDWGGEECKPYLITSGTRITIYKIFEHQGTGLMSGNHLKVIAFIEDGPFTGYIVDINDFLTDPYAYRRILPEIDSSKLELVEN